MKTLIKALGEARPSFNPTQGQGQLYVQHFDYDESIWFYRTGTRKNGNADGYQIANYGRNRKPRRSTIPRRDIPSAYSRGGLWAITTIEDLPRAIRSKLNSVMG